jgi:methionyl-tRNA synthetase
VAIFGNFVNRSFVLMHKLCKSKVPPLHTEVMDAEDRQVFEDIKTTRQLLEESIGQFRFRDGLFAVIDLARKGNQYLQKKQPWIVARQTVENGLPVAEAQAVIDNCLHICLQLCANLAIYCNPFLPNTAKKLLNMMKVVDKMLDWENAGKVKLLSAGYTLRAPELLFRKIEDEEMLKQVEKLKNSAPVAKQEQKMEVEKDAVAAKPEIQYDDFAKLDLKVGTIIAAEKVQKADKLLKLSVDMGTETRTIVSGIALHFSPEEIIGKQVVVVANLATRKMRGIESQGMILMAEDDTGKLHFVSPASIVNPGAGVS